MNSKTSNIYWFFLYYLVLGDAPQLLNIWLNFSLLVYLLAHAFCYVWFVKYIGAPKVNYTLILDNEFG
jgi:hypothetical protein